MLILSVIVFYVSILAALSTENGSINEDEYWRLPRTMHPLAYYIKLTTNVHLNGSRAYTGEVVITVIVLESTNRIILHSKELEVQYLVVIDSTATMEDIRFHYEPLNDFLIIESDDGFKPNHTYWVDINFFGQLRLDNFGFYRSKYIMDGEVKYLAVTQFEPNYAHYAFPCFDEPSYKAKFELHITHDESYDAISTETVKDQTSLHDNKIVTSFHETPLIPVYTLAFAISDFSAIKCNSSTPEQSFYSRSNAVEHLNFALNNSVMLLKTLEDYYNLTFYLSKIDNIAVPDIFGAAMENLGLITYHESISIIDEDNAPFNQKMSSMLTVAHELTHQFFGNLVTPEWWSYIWLSEGIASLFEYYAVDILHPEYKIMFLFNSHTLQTVLKKDSLNETTAMNNLVNDPTEISSVFSSISNEKSACVMRMIQCAFGDALFKQTLNYYLTEYKGKNVIPDDLYTAFDIVYNMQHGQISISFEQYIGSWADRKGYPLVYVTYNQSTQMVSFSQKEFWSDPRVLSNSGNWWIPINIATEIYPNFDSTIADFFIEGVESKHVPSTDIPYFDPNKWYVINKQQTGYYRVNYDNENWNRLSKQLQNNKDSIHILNRAQIIDDSFTLAKSSRIPYVIPFSVAEYLKYETDYNPWMTAIIHFDELDRLIEDENTLVLFRQFILKQIQLAYDHLGHYSKSDDTLLMKYLRRSANYFTCRMGNEHCKTETYTLLQNILSTGIDVDPDIRWEIYCNGLRQANESEFLSFMKKLQSSTDRYHRGVMIEGLSCSRNELNLKQFLESTLTNNSFGYTDEEEMRVVQSVVKGSRNGIMHVFQFYSDHSAEYFENIEKRLTLLQSLLAIAQDITTPTQYNALSDLLIDKFSSIINEQLRLDILSVTDINMEWNRSDKAYQIRQYFEDYYATPSSTQEPTTTENGEPNKSNTIYRTLWIFVMIKVIYGFL